MKTSYTKDDLVNLEKKHDVLLAIDSDGCVFDSMSVKQRVFREGVVEFWDLGDAETEVHRICERVGLYSPWRGLNRFQLILKFFQSLEDNCVAAKGFASQGQKKFQCLETLPTQELEAFVESGKPLSMAELEMWIEQTGSSQLLTVLEWSRAMSRRIAEIEVFPVFDGVFQVLEKLHAQADLIVVSQTTEEALVREWNHAGLTKFVDVIAGAELGSKTESLKTVMTGRYAPDKVLMIGDAPGDLEAARAAGCLFFPIIPGAENDSWIELRTEGLSQVLAGSFQGASQDELISRFTSVLSAVPPQSGSLQRP